MLRFALPLGSALLAVTPSCGPGPEAAAPVEILVYAAASTRDALRALESDYERTHGVELTLNFGSSSDLANQIVAAGQADVFLSADEKEMDKVAAAGLIAADSRLPLLGNQLVVIEPADGPTQFAEPFDPAQLAGAGIELLSLADVQSVPAGRYAKAWLEARGVWEQVAARVLPGVDVRAALAAVESGGAQAGIVYRTDAALTGTVRVVHAVPLEEGPRISYPLAVLSGRPHEDAARAFASFLAGPEGSAAFESVGFTVLPKGP